MIPYDDLVVALATWRARQGLAVSSLSGALSPPQGFAQPVLTPMTMRAPVAPPRPQSPPTPPTPTPVVVAAPPPTPRSSGGTLPPPLAPPLDDSLDDSLLEAEGAYENEGDDFAVAFSAADVHPDAESTAIGGAPRPGHDFGEMTNPNPDLPGAGHEAGHDTADATGEHTALGAEHDPDRHNW